MLASFLQHPQQGGLLSKGRQGHTGALRADSDAPSDSLGACMCSWHCRQARQPYWVIRGARQDARGRERDTEYVISAKGGVEGRNKVDVVRSRAPETVKASISVSDRSHVRVWVLMRFPLQCSEAQAMTCWQTRWGCSTETALPQAAKKSRNYFPPKMTILSSFTNSHVASNLYEWLPSVKHDEKFWTVPVTLCHTVIMSVKWSF